MPEIQHRVGIHAPLASVRAHLVTLDGLGAFWTSRVKGDPTRGGSLKFYFKEPEPSAVMEVIEASPQQVVWKCADGPPEWIGTEFSFSLSSAGDETVVYFINSGWRETGEFMGTAAQNGGTSCSV